MDFVLSNECQFKIEIDKDKCCCVCFTEWYYINDGDKDLSLSDIEISYFKNNIIPDQILVKSCCNVHYICIGCIRKLINNYENHVINESNSHFSCPYPFKECVTEIGFKNVFNHNTIKKICLSENEWDSYMTQAERFSFTGFTIIKCPLICYKTNTRCDTNILVENDLIKTTPIGEFIIECSQNIDCLKRFCFNCKQKMHFYENICYDCKTIHENENPNVYNYYFNKNMQENNMICGSNEEYDEKIFSYEESSYLYLNKEITVEIAIDQILSFDNHIICGLCKITLYKTEKCNGLSHHNLERCYVCGRIGYPIRGLGEHWNINGIHGCFRFDHDNYIKRNIPEYICNELCYSHEKGDCTISNHQYGIEKLQLIRNKGYIYHMIKSLLSELRFIVYDKLYEIFQGKQLLHLLPYKQTLVLLNKYKKEHLNYSEDIVYSQLCCKNPDEILKNKNEYLEADEYISLAQLKESCKESYKESYKEYNYRSREMYSQLNEDALSSFDTSSFTSNEDIYTLPIQQGTSPSFDSSRQGTLPIENQRIYQDFIIDIIDDPYRQMLETVEEVPSPLMQSALRVSGINDTNDIFNDTNEIESGNLINVQLNTLLDFLQQQVYNEINEEMNEQINEQINEEINEEEDSNE